jgi:hypothetical protein
MHPSEDTFRDFPVTCIIGGFIIVGITQVHSKRFILIAEDDEDDRTL